MVSSASGRCSSPTSPAGRGFSAWAGVNRTGVVTVVVTPRRFGRLAQGPFRFSLSFALSFFGPLLGTPFRSCVPQSLLWPRLTSPRLSARGSPRVRVCSFRSCLWALQKAVSDCRVSRVLACSPPDSCLAAHLCSFGRTFACHPFAPAPYGADLTVRLRLASLPPSGTFHPDRPNPCRAHERRFPTRRGSKPRCAMALGNLSRAKWLCQNGCCGCGRSMIQTMKPMKSIRTRFFPDWHMTMNHHSNEL